ncbi:MAG: hypothetical protein BZY80_07010 [SAR202 cluster bacterium Io17-Chloro-G2]|nr:MAG: hypothetical protein BZY80_07010 [SAR202 cluster bacterium Io17-Chloro-G2]
MTSGSNDQVYQSIGVGYSAARRPDPRIQRLIDTALGDARSVVNVGAGTGNYEPAGRRVVAVEPSLKMIGQRRAGSAPATRAVAEALPFGDQTFEASLATFTLHHWTDLAGGMSEMRRVARRQVVLLFEPWETWKFWLVEYFPECLSLPSEIRAPSVEDVRAYLDVQTVLPVPVPADCIDGFAGAYWRRPEAYLDSSVRAGISSLAQLSGQVAERCVQRLREDLASGEWDARYGYLRELPEIDLGYRLLIAG